MRDPALLVLKGAAVWARAPTLAAAFGVWPGGGWGIVVGAFVTRIPLPGALLTKIVLERERTVSSPGNEALRLATMESGL